MRDKSREMEFARRLVRINGHLYQFLAARHVAVKFLGRIVRLLGDAYRLRQPRNGIVNVTRLRLVGHESGQRPAHGS